VWWLAVGARETGETRALQSLHLGRLRGSPQPRGQQQALGPWPKVAYRRVRVINSCRALDSAPISEQPRFFRNRGI
jgi:hypothetical protein